MIDNETIGWCGLGVLSPEVRDTAGRGHAPADALPSGAAAQD
jgi:hypothetical protein